jgi:hypothetical protein
MGTFQLGASVQNDGNFSHLDQFNPATGLVKRIEVFRSSQPLSRFGMTGPGTAVDDLCGNDHLGPRSNCIHRSVYSEGQRGGPLVVLLEGREEMNPDGLPDGSLDIRTRDLNPESPSFGQILKIVVIPTSDGYELIHSMHEGRLPQRLIKSPLQGPVADLLGDAPDIGAPLDESGASHTSRVAVASDAGRAEVDSAYGELTALAESKDQAVWRETIDSYLQFGDLGPKSVHPGINLVGESADLVSEYLVWRKYRWQMVVLGRLYVPEMARALDDFGGPLSAGQNNARPGVYSLYLLGYRIGISLYRQVLDKVYSDYGDVPMQLRPGSRIETGREPVVDAARAIQTAADLADIFYLRQ